MQKLNKNRYIFWLENPSNFIRDSNKKFEGVNKQMENLYLCASTFKP